MDDDQIKMLRRMVRQHRNAAENRGRDAAAYLRFGGWMSVESAHKLAMTAWRHALKAEALTAALHCL